MLALGRRATQPPGSRHRACGRVIGGPAVHGQARADRVSDGSSRAATPRGARARSTTLDGCSRRVQRRRLAGVPPVVAWVGCSLRHAFVTADAEARRQRGEIVCEGVSSCTSGRVRVDGREVGGGVAKRSPSGLGERCESNSAAVGRGARKAQRWEPSRTELQLTLDVVQRQLPPPSCGSLPGWVDLASTSSVGFEHVEPVLDRGLQ